jgi:hypothetical protein
MDDPGKGDVRRTKPLAKKGYVSAVRRSMESREIRRGNPASKAYISMGALLLACLYIIVRVWFAMHSDSATERPHAERGSVVNIQLMTPRPNPALTPSTALPTGGKSPVPSQPQDSQAVGNEARTHAGDARGQH